MENMPSDNFVSGTLTEAKKQTALIRRSDVSMKNGGGGRFQLLTSEGEAFEKTETPVGMAGPTPAES